MIFKISLHKSHIRIFLSLFNNFLHSSLTLQLLQSATLSLVLEIPSSIAFILCFNVDKLPLLTISLLIHYYNSYYFKRKQQYVLHPPLHLFNYNYLTFFSSHSLTVYHYYGYYLVYHHNHRNRPYHNHRYQY